MPSSLLYVVTSDMLLLFSLEFFRWYALKGGYDK